MSSRFMNHLRRNAMPVMVVMGIVCMITFVAGPALIELANSVRRGASEDRNPVVVTWAKGKVRSNELSALRYRHQLAHEFLSRVIMRALQRGGRPIIEGQPASMEQGFRVGIPDDFSEETAVQTLVLAEEGRRLGIVVDLSSVKDFLRQISSPELKDGDWVEIASDLLESQKASLAVGQLFEHLAYELKAQHVRNLAMAALYAQGVGPIVPPGEAYDLFNRINRRFAIEAYPIDAKSFVSEVKGEPSAAEIQKLYDEGKFRDPNPNFDEPGFHKPHKLAFTYLKVSFTPFLDEAKKQITEDQIEEAYKKDVEQGKHKVQELPPTTPPTGEKKEDGKEGEKSEEANKDTEPKKNEQPQADKSQADKSQDKSEKPGDSKQESDTKADKKSDCEDDPPAEAAADKKSSGAAAKPTDAGQPTEKPADEKEAEKKSDSDKPGEAPPAKEQKFKPLSEVRDQILNTLAQPIAEEARKKAVAEVVGVVERYGKSYRRYLDAKNIGKAKDLKEPEKLDLAPLAAKYNFEVGQTPLVDQFEVSNYPIGKEVQQIDFAALQQRRQFRWLSFADIAFSQDDPLYKPEEARGSEPDMLFVYFRTAEEKTADVTLKEARPQIIEFWKQRQAYELARGEAQRLADKAKSAMSLVEVVPDAAKLVTPPAFSWMTPGSFGMSGPEMSPVPGIELAGQDFMQGVFSLVPGQCGVAPNQAHSVVYLVRVNSQEPDEEKLKSQFLESGYNQLVIMLAQRESLFTSVEWYRGVAREYQVKWQRPPDEQRRRL
jgi:hypothetical protein